MTFRYPKGPDDPEVDEYTRGQFSTVHRVAGANDPRALFGDAPKTPAPWPSASRSKSEPPWRQSLVTQALQEPNFRDVDPAQLHSMQSSVTRQGVDYYMGDEYEQTGSTFADQGDAGNRFPVVYNRRGENKILSGHHRAAAALLQGRQFRVNYVEEPWE